MLVLVWLVISDLYLFHLIVFLNPVFNCSKSLLSSLVDKVTADTYKFVSVISNVAFVGLLTSATTGSASGSASPIALLVITRFSDQAKIRFISQLINRIFSVFKRLLKCYNSTTVLTSLPVLSPSNLPLTLAL